MPVKYLFLSLLPLILSACGSIAWTQASCERTSANFPELADCIDWGVAASANGWMQNNPEVKLYMLTANQLSQRVKRQEMSDMDARAELQTLYVDLEGQRDARRTAETSR
jgi:hypothetical protein